MFGWKKTSINTRLGKKSDVKFVLSEVQKGLANGCFYFEGDNFLREFEKELLQVTNAHERDVMIADFLFIFDDKRSGKTIGFALLTGRNDASGLASHIEIRMFGVEESSRGQGMGKFMLQELKRVAPGHNLEASCLPASAVMARLLDREGFTQIKVSPFGKRTFRFAPSEHGIK